MQETDLRGQDIGLIQFELIPNLVLLLTIAGVFNAGLATAREWEDLTITELLAAPISRTCLIAGKLLAGWITALLVAGVVLVLGAVSGFLRHQGLSWGLPWRSSPCWRWRAQGWAWPWGPCCAAFSR